MSEVIEDESELRRWQWGIVGDCIYNLDLMYLQNTDIGTKKKSMPYEISNQSFRICGTGLGLLFTVTVR